MSNYSYLERRIAYLLSRFPGLKKVVKEFYQRISFLIHGNASEQFSINQNATLWQPEDGIEIYGSWSAEQFFGYYDKCPWGINNNRYITHLLSADELCREVSVAVFDFINKEVQVWGKTRAWSTQQGAMSQWLNFKGKECLIFNDLVCGKLGLRICASKDTSFFLPWPIQALSPVGDTYLSLDYRRIYSLCPEYGYSIAFDAETEGAEDGINLVDIHEGTAEMIVENQKLVEQYPASGLSLSTSELNHCLYSPNGKAFLFMQRWYDGNGRCSRLFFFDLVSREIKLLLDQGMVSHYSWLNDAEIILWGRTKGQGDHYYLLDVGSGEYKVVGGGLLDKYGDGHPSVSPNGKWLVTDTYPDKSSQQHLFLFDLENEALIRVGSFLQPLAFRGAARVDLHPRWNRSGDAISIDSTHEGLRKNFIVDVSKIVN